MIDSYIPHSTQLSLCQTLGLSSGLLKREFEEYRSQSSGIVSIEGFSIFCVRRHGCEEPTLPYHWKPTIFEIPGIPVGIVRQELHPSFLSQFAGKNIGADFTNAFIEFCNRSWIYDCRNPNTTFATFMKVGWKPSPDARKFVSSIVGDTHVDAFIGEFCIYWRDNGGVSADWNGKLRQHASSHSR